MGLRKEKLGNEEFEILDHDQVPGYRKAFLIILLLAVVYFIFIFFQGTTH